MSKTFELILRQALYQINSSFGQSAYGLTSADFNHDGLLDFAASYATSPFNYSTISLFFNTGDLTFEQADMFSLNYSYIKDLDAGDYDGDGDIDLVFSFDEYRWYDNFPFNMNGTLVLARNNGANDFSNLSLINQWISEDNMNPERRINLQITSADYDHDSDIDMAVGDNSGKIELLLNQGNGSFCSNGVIGDFGQLSWGLTSSDVNNDGYMDLIVGAATDTSMNSPPGFLYYLPNTGTSYCFNNKACAIVGNITSGIGSGCLVPIDIDCDNCNEILAGIEDKVIAYKNENSEYYSTCIVEFPKNTEGFFEDLSKGGMTVGDFNDDGYEDFITGGVQGVIRLFLNNQTYQ